MADALASVQNSLHALTIGAKFGLAMIFRGLQIQCIRSLTEVPQLELQPVWNISFTTLAGSVPHRLLLLLSSPHMWSRNKINSC